MMRARVDEALIVLLILVTVGCSSADPGTGSTGAPAMTAAATGAAAGPVGIPGSVDAGASAQGAAPAGVVTYTEVFKQVIEGCGASFCHGGNVGMFFVGSEKETYDQLINVVAKGADTSADGTASCSSMGAIRVVPKDVNASLLYRKLVNTQPCGSSMPPPSAGPLLAAEKADLVKRWIEGGALPGATTLTPSATNEPAIPDGGTVVFDAGPLDVPVNADANWRFFGYDSDNSFYARAERKLSPANVPMLTMLWGRPNFGTGMYVTPSVVDGVVYYSERDRVLVAANAKTGEDLWRTSVSGGGTYGELNSSALITEDRVYIGGMSSAYAFDKKTGRQVWARGLATHPDTHIFSSPVLAGDLIVIGLASHELVNAKGDYSAIGGVIGLDKNSGEIKWQIPTAGPTVMSLDGMPSGAGGSVWSTGAVDPVRKTVYIGVGQSYEAPASALTDSLLAIDYEKGMLLWNQQFTANDVYVATGSCATTLCMGDFDVGAAPNLFKVDGKDAVGVGSKAGIYKAFDRDTGAPLWEHMLTQGTQAGGMIASAAVGEGAIYITSNEWKAFRFPTSRGGHDPTDVSKVFKLDADTGQPIWPEPIQLRAPAVGHMTLANGVVYIGLVDGWGFALNAETGAELWKFDLGHDLACGFSVVDGVVYGGSGGLWMSSNSRPGGSIFAFTADPAME